MAHIQTVYLCELITNVNGCLCNTVIGPIHGLIINNPTSSGELKAVIDIAKSHKDEIEGQLTIHVERADNGIKCTNVSVYDFEFEKGRFYTHFENLNLRLKGYGIYKLKITCSTVFSVSSHDYYFEVRMNENQQFEWYVLGKEENAPEAT